VELASARSGGFAPCPECTALARAEAERDQGGEAAEIAELEAYRARGLFGPVESRPGDVADVAASFRCPDCGSGSLQIGARLVRHGCGGAAGGRPVAWRSYGGPVVVLSWWRRRG
jgi:hypothetical protein